MILKDTNQDRLWNTTATSGITDNMASFSDKHRPTIIFVIFPNAKLLDIAGPMQVFADAKRYNGEDYEIVLVSTEGGDVLTDAGVALHTERMDQWHGRPIHTLLIAGGLGSYPASESPVLLAGIAKLVRQSGRIGSVCTGALVLAAAGILDGRRAVTHWWACKDLTDRYPNVAVEPDRIFTKDGNVWTSAGVTTGIDMALAMVAEDSGRKTTLDLARSLVAFMARPGGQSQFSAALNSQSQDTAGRFDTLHSWIADNIEQDLSVARLAEKAGMSERNFARVYQLATGRTPAKAVELFRVEAARDLLEETTIPINVIARKTGFVDDERLRRAVQRVLGISPKECRERFGKKEV